jgi:hypothetical protein
LSRARFLIVSRRQKVSVINHQQHPTRNATTMHPKSDQIRVLNDHLRTTFTGGLIVVTSSIAELDMQRRTRILSAVRDFKEFDADNDPYHEHDVAFFDVDGERYFFKVDYYDRNAQHHSPNPADAGCTCRILTIGHHSDY